jgi:hypothetical protein
MKSIKQIREQYDLVTEKETKEESKLTALVRAGLVDTTKLPIIKRALNKDNKVLTPTERNTLLALLDSLMAQVLSSHNVYTKVKQNVMSMNEELKPMPTKMNDMPSIIILKRRAIRVYPGGQNVGLYYSQQLDRYVAVPFGRREEGKSVLSMYEETEQLNELSDQTERNAYAKRSVQARRAPMGSVEQSRYKGKAAKTGVRIMAKYARKNGINDVEDVDKMHAKAKDLVDYTDNYDKADRAVSSKVTVKRTKPTNPNKIKKLRARNNKGKPATTTAPSKNTYNPAHDNSTGKPRSKKDRGADWQAYNNDQESRGTGSVGKDLVKNLASVQGNAVGHTVGAWMYRKKNPTAMAKPVNEKREYGAADAAADAASFIPGPAGSAASLASAGLSVSRGDYVGAALDVAGAVPVLGYAAKAAKVAKGAKAVGKLAKGAKAASKLGKLRKLSRGMGGSGGNQASTPNKPVSKEVGYGGPSKLNIKSTNTLAAYRERQENSKPNVQEMVELNLGGNRFSLNSGIANKVLNVYQSLNEDNRQKMVDKMNEGEESLNKVISFAIRH